VLLPHHVLVQEFLDLPRRRDRAEQRLAARQLPLLLPDDVVRKVKEVAQM
jgi:hypothetical protein